MLIILLILNLFIYQTGDEFAEKRYQMVEKQIIERGIDNPSVIKAMRKVPRHLFVPEAYRPFAYIDGPLFIGHDQTISQPYIVAYMTDILKPAKDKKALEIGTGSGYQAAVLAEIADTVYTIEIVPELAAESKKRLADLRYTNVVVKHGDGYKGWPEHAPFDMIIVTAAPETIPQPLLDQLAENGRMVIPVGKQGAIQELKLITKKNGKIKQEKLIPVRFVPLTRE